MAAGKKYIHCPFRDFDGCCDGSVAGRGLTCAYLLVHLRRSHLVSDAATGKFKKLIESDCVLFDRVDCSLGDAGYWLCGDCMVIHTISKWYRHADGSSFSPPEKDDSGLVACSIQVIRRPEVPMANVVSGDGAWGADEFVSLDVGVLSSVLDCSFSTVKSLPGGCKVGFAQD